jgi:hypothetical protein
MAALTDMMNGDGFPSTGAVRDVRLTSILLKNSNFGLDHNSEDRWQPQWKFPEGLGGATGFAACDPLIGLAVATTGLENTMRAEAGFSPSLNF